MTIYLAGTCLYTLMIIVPILSLGLWFLKFKLVFSDETNHLRPWMLVYSLSGILQVIYFKLVLWELIQMIKEGLNGSASDQITP